MKTVTFETWNVFRDGEFLGTVNAINEDLARDAAIEKFEVLTEDTDFTICGNPISRWIED